MASRRQLFGKRPATVGDVVRVLRSSGISRSSPEPGRALTLTETAHCMYAEGHFDRVPSRREIMELERSALAKLRRMGL
jgi:hypothetical protein